MTADAKNNPSPTVCLPRSLAVVAFGALMYIARHSTDPKVKAALEEFEKALIA